MQSTELTDRHINGTMAVTLTGTITGFVRYPGWTEVQLDPGLPGGTIVALRLADDDPLELEATEGAPTVIEPTGEVLDPEVVLRERAEREASNDGGFTA